MEDPRSKQGVIGAFCRCYSISEAIATFLPDAYEPADDSLSRFTFVGSRVIVGWSYMAKIPLPYTTSPP
ncbi:hypothetical protein [Brevibacillus sp. IT-7CA2]|uniref:hypothetical protein n=1 Tax=Brevibacillus sp. IT-7CA2 TaxID=3026436 RepID=UPI0039E16BDD